jgi:hypothetical protein
VASQWHNLNTDGSSDRKQTILANVVYWKHMNGGTMAFMGSIQPSYRETAEELVSRTAHFLQLCESGAIVALNLVHNALHGKDMGELELKSLGSLAGVYGCRGTMGDNAANETSFNKLLDAMLGCKQLRLVCNMHSVDNAAGLTLVLAKVLEVIGDALNELAELHEVEAAELLPPGMPTKFERYAESAGAAGAKKASELLSFTMGSRVDDRNAKLKNAFNLAADKAQLRSTCACKQSTRIGVQAPAEEGYKKVNLSKLPGTTRAVDVPLSISEAIVAFHHPRCLPAFLAQYLGSGNDSNNVIDNLVSQCECPPLLCEQLSHFAGGIYMHRPLLSVNPQQSYQDAAITAQHVVTNIDVVLDRGEAGIEDMVHSCVIKPERNVVGLFGPVPRFEMPAAPQIRKLAEEHGLHAAQRDGEEGTDAAGAAAPPLVADGDAVRTAAAATAAAAAAAEAQIAAAAELAAEGDL